MSIPEYVKHLECYNVTGKWIIFESISIAFRTKKQQYTRQPNQMTKDRRIAFKSGSNLIVFREIGELQQYWEMRWKNARLRSMLKQARSERIDDFEAPFKMYLPKDGIILEAGCGTGRIVAALQARGFTVEGIDYASETIARVQEVDPSLDVRKGDILAIDRPDGYYGGYVSLACAGRKARTAPNFCNSAVYQYHQAVSGYIS